MWKAALITLGVVTLSACAPPPPQDDYFDSVSGESARIRAAEERLRQAEIINPNQPAPSNNIIDTTTGQPVADPAALASLTPSAAVDRTTISDSQDFGAITERETIETDAAKLATLRETYKVFEPEALPQRSSGLNLVAYANENINERVGKKRYSRPRAAYQNATRDYCTDYFDAELAQIAFLNKGGPRRDPGLLDADGDGFACAWTPGGYLAQIRAAEQQRRLEAEAKARAQALAATESTDDLAAAAVDATTN